MSSNQAAHAPNPEYGQQEFKRAVYQAAAETGFLSRAQNDVARAYLTVDELWQFRSELHPQMEQDEPLDQAFENLWYAMSDIEHPDGDVYKDPVDDYDFDSSRMIEDSSSAFRHYLSAEQGEFGYTDIARVVLSSEELEFFHNDPHPPRPFSEQSVERYEALRKQMISDEAREYDTEQGSVQQVTDSVTISSDVSELRDYMAARSGTTFTVPSQPFKVDPFDRPKHTPALTVTNEGQGPSM